MNCSYDVQGKLQCKEVKYIPQVIKQEAQVMTCVLYPTSRPILNDVVIKMKLSIMVDGTMEHVCVAKNSRVSKNISNENIEWEIF